MYERESVFECVCVRERERDCTTPRDRTARGRERERERESERERGDHSEGAQRKTPLIQQLPRDPPHQTPQVVQHLPIRQSLVKAASQQGSQQGSQSVRQSVLKTVDQ